MYGMTYDSLSSSAHAQFIFITYVPQKVLRMGDSTAPNDYSALLLMCGMGSLMKPLISGMRSTPS